MPSQTPKTARRSRGPRDDRGVTLDAITIAARGSFAENGWAGTTMRGVAKSAGVDPALVHYYFSSKEQLLDASTMPPAEWIATLQEIPSVPLRERGDAIVQRVIWAWTRPEIRDVLRSILLTAAHEQRTRQKLRAFFGATLLPAVAGRFDEHERNLRASLVAAQVSGVIMIRWIWEIEPLASVTDDQLIALIAPTLQRYLSGQLSGPGEGKNGGKR
jgi:AcrR family transcriptional regulator